MVQSPEPPPAPATETGPDDAPAPTPVPPAEAPSLRTASLVVVTQPPGAEVLLDDESVGVTPLEVDELPARVYAVALRHPYYNAVETELEVSAGESRHFERELDRATGTLHVTISPPGAWIARAASDWPTVPPRRLPSCQPGRSTSPLGRRATSPPMWRRRFRRTTRHRWRSAWSPHSVP
ncbi:MAG: PEGA domain-containing protein [Gammaproteobacteria bacterium]|nr:PEGA domain-containing protein [Gammaproteobacteria bacterium]